MGKHINRRTAKRQDGQTPATISPASDKPDSLDSLPPDKLAIYKRLVVQGDWNPQLRDQMMREARSSGLDRAAAQAWVYAELDRMYPPKPAEKPDKSTTIAPTVEDENDAGQAGNARVCDSPIGPESRQAHARESGLRGLDAIPPSWPALPPSAQLAAELGWCQANRLLVVAETPRGTTVDLSRAVEPAPSRSALAWLETAIRSYAKFTDVLAKVAAGGSDESEDVRRERVAQHEIERLLAQMGG